MKILTSEEREILLADLLYVRDTGRIRNKIIMDKLEEADLIFFGSPRPEVHQKRNCFHMTEKGNLLIDLLKERRELDN